MTKIPKLLSLWFILFQTTKALSQEATTPDDNETVVAQDASTPDVVDQMANSTIGDKLIEIIATQPLIALITAIIGVFVVPILQNIAYRARIKRVFSGVRVNKGHRKNSIMMLGLGDTGKTTLSRRICGDMKKKPSAETKAFRLFTGNTSANSQKFDYYVSDYRGQNVGTLVTGFIQQQLQERSPFRFNTVNSLILVVDIVEPDKSLKDLPTSKHPRQKEPDLERMEENVRQWNRTALDAVFGMHTIDSLRYVCLFINKRDRMSSWNDTVKNKVRKVYQPLEEDLRRRCSFEDDNKMEQQYAFFEVIIGAAGEEVPVQLLDRLQALSVPLDEDFTKLSAKLGGE